MNPGRRASRSPIDGVDADVFRPRVPRGYGWLRRGALLAAVVLVGAGAAWGADIAVTTCGGLGSGVSRVDLQWQCVGVSDGSTTFGSDSELNEIESRIYNENTSVARQGLPYVRIALLSPLTADSTSFMTRDQVLHAMEGVYVAQWRANHDPSSSTGFADRGVALVQVVLANEGTHQDEWQPVVHQLEGMVGGDHPLVAVVGLGTSIPQTRDAARDLSSHEVPMVGAVISADGLNSRETPGLVRVSPSNSDYAEALRRYLQTRPDLRNGLLVYDSSMPDLYVSTLKTAYQSRLGQYMKFAPLGFVSLAHPQEGPTQLFLHTVGSICSDRPDMVFYAGRGLDLTNFVDSLAGRECGSQSRLTVLVGATGLSLNQQTLVDGNLVVVQAASTDPRWWRGGAPAPAHFGDFLSAFLTAFPQLKADPDPALHDGYAIMNHDAFATAVMALRRAGSQGTNGTLSNVAVGRQLFNLSSDFAVPGASGTLVFSSTRDGDPGDKPVPIIVAPSSAPAPAALPAYQTRPF